MVWRSLRTEVRQDINCSLSLHTWLQNKLMYLQMDWDHQCEIKIWSCCRHCQLWLPNAVDKAGFPVCAQHKMSHSKAKLILKLQTNSIIKISTVMLTKSPELWFFNMLVPELNLPGSLRRFELLILNCVFLKKWTNDMYVCLLYCFKRVLFYLDSQMYLSVSLFSSLSVPEQESVHFAQYSFQKQETLQVDHRWCVTIQYMQMLPGSQKNYSYLITLISSVLFHFLPLAKTLPHLSSNKHMSCRVAT